MSILDEAVAMAGVDPRELQAMLMAGQPERTIELARAFEEAGGVAREAYERGRRAHADIAGGFSNDGAPVLDAEAQSREAWRQLGQGGQDMQDVAAYLKRSVSALDEAQANASAAIGRMTTDLNGIAAAWNQHAASAPGAGAVDRQQYLAQAAAVVSRTAGKIQQAIDGYDSGLSRDAADLAARGYVPAEPSGATYAGGAIPLAAPPLGALPDQYRGVSAPNGLFTAGDVAGGFYGARLENSALGFRSQADVLRSSAESNLARLRAQNRVLDADQFYRDLDYHESRLAQAQTMTRKADALKTKANGLPFKVGGPLAAAGIVADIAGGKPPVQAVAAGGAGFAASVGTGYLVGLGAGAASSALAGAAVGSVVPVVGTAVGAVVGAGVGIFASGAVDSLFQNGPDLGQAVDRGLEAVGDTGAAIGHGVASIGRGVAGLFD